VGGPWYPDDDRKPLFETLARLGKPDAVQPVSHDPVESPSHYTAGGIETIDFIEAKDLGYHLGNVVKYVSRAGRKGDRVEDLRKARWYLDRAIERASA
jgi:hypothetical protein